MSAEPTQSPLSNPYVGPVPFLEGQTLYGRERETQALADLLISKRIVLLIAPSGAGKTSLIQAALVPRLRARLNPLPIMRLDLASEAGIGQGNRYVFSALRSLETRFSKSEQLSDEATTGLTFDSYCARRVVRADGGGDRRFPLLILDQFEELFTLDRFDWKEKEQFMAQLGEALGGAASREGDEAGAGRDGHVPIWALLAMREDHVAELEPFLDLIPTGLTFRYRLEPLEREGAIAAVVGPAGDYFEAAAAERLVDDLRTLRAVAPGGEERWRLGRFIEPVQLQVVCRRLWDKVVMAQGRRITLSDVSSAGQMSEVDAALAGYYDVEVERAATGAGVRERDIRDWIGARLISRTKVRTRVLREPVSLGKLDEALQRLVRGHVLRIDVAGEREWVELSHDRLVNPVLTSNEEWQERHLALVQKQAKLWAESGRPDDLLFSGEQLDEAERFAEGHPEELWRDDWDFLAESRRERERLAEGIRQQREIEARNAKLRKQRRLLAGSTTLALVATVVMGILAFRLFVEKNRVGNLLGNAQLLQSVAMARSGAVPQALGTLVEAQSTSAKRRGASDLRVKFDLGLIQVLGSYPPIERPAGGHDHIARALAFSSDGELLFSGGWDNLLKIRRLTRADGTEVVLDDHRSNIYSLAYHGGRQLVASTEAGGLIYLWQIRDAQVQKVALLNEDRVAHRGQVTSSAFNPEGMLLATASWDKQIVLWDVTDLAAPRKIARFGSQYHVAPIYQIAFLQGGRYSGGLVSADLLGKVGVWFPGDHGGKVGQKPERSFSSMETINKDVGIYALALSPSGRWIAAGDSEGDVLVWDLEASGPVRNGVRLRPTLSHRDKIFSMAFSRDSLTLVTVGSDQVLLRWNFPPVAKDVTELEQKTRVRRVEGWGEKLYSVALHPQRDGVVAVGGSKRISIVDLNRLNPLAMPIDTTDRASQAWRSLATTPDLATLAALSVDDGKTIHIWRRGGEGYRLLENPLNMESEQASIALSADGKWLAALSCKAELMLQSLEAGAGAARATQIAPAPRRCPLATLTFNRDGNRLATAIGSVLYLWSRSASGEWKAIELARFEQGIRTVAFSPTGEFFVAAGDFGRIKLWEIGNIGRPGAPPAHESTGAALEIVRALAFNPNGKTLISGGEDATLREWSVPGLEKKSESVAHKRAVTALVFSLREGVPVLFSGDQQGALVMCSGGVSDEQCAPLGRPTGSAITKIAANADLGHLVVAGDGIWVWDFRREILWGTAERLSGKGS